MRHFAVPLAILTLTLLSSDSFAQGKSQKFPRPGKTESLNADGVRIRLFKDAAPMPLVSLKTHMLEQTFRNGDKKKVEAYDVREQWMFRQCVGRWGTDSATISVFKLTLAPPDSPLILDKYLLKDDYEKWEKNNKPEWDDEKVSAWAAFLAAGEVKGEPKTVSKSGGKTILSYNVQTIKSYGADARNSALYTVSDADGRRFAVLYEYSPSLDQEKTLKTIDDSIKSVSFFSTQAAGAPRTAPKTGRKKDFSEEYLENRENVIQNIRNLKDWSFMETDNYIIVTNARDKKMLSLVQEDIEKCRHAFSWIYPLKRPLDAVSVVRVFNKRSDFVAYIPGDRKDFDGLWMSDRKELAISPLDDVSKKDNREAVLSTLRHEGFHQYIFFACGQRRTSAWFNEGNAKFFEDVDFKGAEKFSVELPEDKAAVYESIAAKSPAILKSSIAELLHMDYVRFYEERTIRENYALAAALVHFLIKGAPVMKTSADYSKILPGYYDSFLESGDPEKATEAAWKDVDMDKFVADFAEFWTSKKFFKKSQKYLPPKAEAAKAE